MRHAARHDDAGTGEAAMRPPALCPGCGHMTAGAPLSEIDVLVAGGAAAGLCAAIAARRAGATVHLVESAPRALRGGNTRHARNFRIAHDRPAPWVPDAYPADAFLADLRRVTEHATDDPVARRLIDGSADLPDFLIDNGVALQPTSRGVLPYSRRTAFLLGGGKAMINALFATAVQLGVGVSYDTALAGLHVEPGHCTVELRRDGSLTPITARAVVVATGGDQADRTALRRQLGDAADTVVVRGTPHADGSGLRLLLAAGAAAVGTPGLGHLVPVDARGPAVDGGIVTRITGIPYGIVVDQHGRRVADERADLRRTHYAQWGPRIAGCPGGRAALVLDHDGLSRAAPTALPPVTAPTLAGLATALAIDPAGLDATVRDVDATAEARGGRPIRVPPFAGYPLVAGVTFLHHGVAVDAAMRVRLRTGGVADRLLAAGGIMAATVLRRGYLAGLGVTLAAVSGRIAGEEAARVAAR